MRKITFMSSLVVIIMIPWEGVIDLPGIGNAIKLIGIIVAGLWFGTVFLTSRIRKPGPFHYALFLFVLWNAVSVYWSSDSTRSAAHVVTWVQLLVLVLILWDLYTTRAALLAGLQMYILGAYIAIGYAVKNYLGNAAYYTNYERFSPGDMHPGGFGFLLALGIPVAWYLAIALNNAKFGGVLKIINYGYIPAALLGISLSGTRTALIASIPAMAFGLTSLTRLRVWARVAIFLLLTSAVLIMLPRLQELRSFQRFSTIEAEITEGDLNNRVNNWQEGITTFLEHPLLGVGSNMYRSVNSLDKVAHNSFLSVLVQLGFIGFAIFGMILATALTLTWSQPKMEKSFWLTMLVVWCIGSTTMSWEFKKSTWLFLGLLVVSAALTSHGDEAETVLRQNEPNVPLTAYPKLNQELTSK